MTPRATMADLANSLLHDMARAQVAQAPVSREEVRAAAADEDRATAAYMRAFNEALIGAGDFWDDAFREPLTLAVRRALSGIGLTDADRWDIVLQEVIVQASAYADRKAREVSP